MKSYIELDVFVESVRLPEGIRFHEWAPGNTVCAVASQPGVRYFDTCVAALERISDGKKSIFEISWMKPPERKVSDRGRILLEAATLVASVDKAIAELEV